MIALHCSVLDGRPMLWSEGVVPGDSNELRRALKAIGMRVSIRKSLTRAVVAWLPHRGDDRVPSSPLLGDEPDKRRKSSVRPVTITALPLDIPLSFAFFSCVREGNISGAGAFFGVSVFWTMQLFEIALHLVFTEKYLSSLVRGTTQWQGCWMPYPENAVASWLDTLTEIKDDCSAGNFRFFFNSRSA